MHVPTAIKQRICKGDYINLSLQLKVAVELTDYANGSSILVLNNGRLEIRPTECKDDIGTIERWNDAVDNLHGRVFVCAPAQKHELLQSFYSIF